ncbi:MAG: hypothetical protein Fur003_1380 [Candidatus Dojkabacteria bacterium]
MDIRRLDSAHLSSKNILKAFVYFSLFTFSIIGLLAWMSQANIAYASEFSPSFKKSELEEYLVIKNIKVNQPLHDIKVVSLWQNNQESVYYTTKETVKEILEEVGVPYQAEDKIEPSLDQVVVTGANIFVKEITYEELEKSFPVEFSTKYISDSTMFEGSTKVVQEGVIGTRVNKYKLTYQDGLLIDNQLISSELVAAPVEQIIAKGSKKLAVSEFNCPKWDAVVDATTSNSKERSWLKFIMRCESACNAGIVSKNGLYYGLFQFMQSTFKNYGGTDIFNGNQQISTALKVYRLGGATQWGMCNAKFNNL